MAKATLPCVLIFSTRHRLEPHGPYVNTSSDYSKAYHSNSLAAYEEEASLYNLITKPNVSKTDRINIQHAAWSITDSDYVADSAVQWFVKQAQANFNNVNMAGFEILSDVSGNRCDRQQEFLVWNPSCNAPEPGSFAMLGGGLLFGLGLIGRNRKKAVTSSQIAQ